MGRDFRLDDHRFSDQQVQNRRLIHLRPALGTHGTGLCETDFTRKQRLQEIQRRVVTQPGWTIRCCMGKVGIYFNGVAAIRGWTL